MKTVWLGLASLGVGTLIFCANSPTDLSFLTTLYLVILAAKGIFLAGYFTLAIAKPSLPTFWERPHGLSLPRFK